MAADRSIEFDFDRIDALIAEEEAALEPKHEASIAYRTVAQRYVAGGVASSRAISSSIFARSNSICVVAAI